MGGPLVRLFTEFDSIKKSACRGNQMESSKQFFKTLLWNRLSDIEIISQDFSSDDPFQNLFVNFLFVKKHGSGEWELLASFSDFDRSGPWITLFKNYSQTFDPSLRSCEWGLCELYSHEEILKILHLKRIVGF